MSSERIDEAAAGWLARLMAPDCSERDREAFEAWCAADAAHADAFAATAQVHADARALGGDGWVRAATRSAWRASAARGRSRIGAWPARFAAAAALLLVVGGTAWFARTERPQQARYATAVGEQRHLELADGTQLQLDTDTDVIVRYDASSREVILDHGRIQVGVAADARRPFSVRSGRGIVRDTGTEFQVARYRGDVRIMLLSGAVNVALAGREGNDASRDLAPGEELRVGDTGELGWPTRVDVDAASSWTHGMLTFKDRPLGDLLEEMNRYSGTKVRVADPALSTLAVSGVFRTGDQASLLQALKTGWSIRAKRVSDHEIALSSAR